MATLARKSYMHPMLRKTTDPAPSFYDTATDTGRYIVQQITAENKNPQDPQAIVEFIAAHDAKTKTAVGVGLLAVAVVLLVWWGQKGSNMPKFLSFLKGKPGLYGTIAVGAFLIYRAWQMNTKNKEVQAALADFIKWAQAVAAAQGQQAQAAPPP